jgi:thiamine biosynthesis lipoprotein
VRFARPLRIDLGGIAKGYCVDRAIAELRRCGASAGLVNAGGDLRAFGARSMALHLRHPADPGRFILWRTIRDAAIATSASYATGRRRCAGFLMDGRSGVRIGSGISVTVRASSALMADALTKVVAATGAQAAPILARYCARAWILTAVGAQRRQGDPGQSWEVSCAAAV